MKKLELKKIIREVLKEQFADDPDLNPIGFGTNPNQGPYDSATSDLLGNMETVGAKGCCKELYLLVRQLDDIGKQRNEIDQLINYYEPYSGPFGFSSWTNALELLEAQAAALIQYQNATKASNNSINSTACCKQGKHPMSGKPKN